VVLDIKEKDKIARLTYIAILRVKKLLGLIFKHRFNIERFQLSISKTKEV
jgi:hypothetical protein